MARSSYVYVVMENSILRAGFTVKHEMKTWLERNPGDYTVWRLVDGLNTDARPPVLMDL